MTLIHRFPQSLVFVTLLLFSAYSQSNHTKEQPQIIIIIDDVGYHEHDAYAFSLPNSVAVAIIPHTPLSRHYGWLSSQTGRDQIIHMPMESLSHHKPEPSEVTAQHSPKEIQSLLASALEQLPNAIGMNNHMGSKLTQLTQPMKLVMQFAKANNLGFVDSRTSRYSKAFNIASSLNVPHLKRDVFIDNTLTHEAIKTQMLNLIQLAKTQGLAVGIAHPHQETLSFLEEFLPKLPEFGVQLTSLKAVFEEQRHLP